MRMKTYREPDVWKRSIEMVEAIYRLTGKFPAAERYGVTSQIQRAAVSVAANIAEGYGRAHRREYLYHLSISRGSLMEVETLLTVAVRLKLANRDEGIEAWDLCQKTGMMLNKLIASLRPGTRTP